MANYYTDLVLGQWKLQKKTKDLLIYERKAKVTLHKTHAMEQNGLNVWGEVVLRQEKKIHIPTSLESLYQFLDHTENTLTEKVIG